ncbi:polysaccharide biosynthesis/export family protein [Vibrio vulnificus]|uniref:polysaccharide biosynthesis/export family protein n=1 Tax=Vibrio vulnificus TaxID=672 RepID=UPI000CD14164|nr:polysaccharide biosynthesis/export family protein [Vibrio vulnificus]POC44141.1 capsular biosynthesis protein [Vibrio vulnificus]HDY8036115.1 polysaccharide export protein [Vibrio vulnificus]
MKFLLKVLLGLSLILAPYVSASISDAGYQLNSGDSISILVYGEDDLSIPNILLTSDGQIDYPYLGRVLVKGKTPKELKEEIEQKLKGDYLVNPKVMVSINKFRSFYVNGEVRRPGSFEYQPGLTIEKAIAIAGGLTDRASRSNIHLTQSQNGETIKKVSLSQKVSPGDIVVIEQSFF